MAYRLVIGNKNTSSWSLRPWLALRHAGIPFRGDQHQAAPARHQGADPALFARRQGADAADRRRRRRSGTAWRSSNTWPRPIPRRGCGPTGATRARSPARCRRRCTRASPRCASIARWSCWPARRWRALPDAVAADVRRIVALWHDCRRRFGASGPLLFGAFTAADAMYAPVATRFRTYLPDLAPYGDDGTAQAYVDALFALAGHGRVGGGRAPGGKPVPPERLQLKARARLRLY